MTSSSKPSRILAYLITTTEDGVLWPDSCWCPNMFYLYLINIIYNNASNALKNYNKNNVK